MIFNGSEFQQALDRPLGGDPDPLAHLYVLVPVVDDEKHNRVGE